MKRMHLVGLLPLIFAVPTAFAIQQPRQANIADTTFTCAAGIAIGAPTGYLRAVLSTKVLEYFALEAASQENLPPSQSPANQPSSWQRIFSRGKQGIGLVVVNLGLYAIRANLAKQIDEHLHGDTENSTELLSTVAHLADVTTALVKYNDVQDTIIHRINDRLFPQSENTSDGQDQEEA